MKVKWGDCNIKIGFEWNFELIDFLKVVKVSFFVAILLLLRVMNEFSLQILLLL